MALITHPVEQQCHVTLEEPEHAGQCGQLGHSGRLELGLAPRQAGAS